MKDMISGGIGQLGLDEYLHPVAVLVAILPLAHYIEHPLAPAAINCV